MKKIIILLISILWIGCAAAQKVGIGTTNPDSLLTVNGSAHLAGNTLVEGNLKLPAGAGPAKVLQSDALGNASWAPGTFVPAGTAPGQMLYWTGTAWATIAPGAYGQSLIWFNGVPTWSTPIVVGSNFGGGIIAYILQSGDPGYIPGEVHGLIAAPSDQSTGIQWYNGSYVTTGATATALGTGNANTNTIVSAQGAGSYAAKLCYDLVLGGYNDWYLPSRDELSKVYLNKAQIGGFSNPNNYWSSSELSNINVWYVYFSNGTVSSFNKNEVTFYVRAIRSF